MHGIYIHTYIQYIHIVHRYMHTYIVLHDEGHGGMLVCEDSFYSVQRNHRIVAARQRPG